MKQSIHLLPKVPEINKLRKKYDSFYKKFKTHITLVYVFEVENQKALVKHIKKAIENIKPFEISFGKFYASDNYVCLEIKSQECWNLYNKLNHGILAGFENKEVEFQPHISIAVMKTPEEAQELITILNKNPILSKTIIEAIHLLTFNEDFSIKSKKSFKIT